MQEAKAVSGSVGVNGVAAIKVNQQRLMDLRMILV